MRSGPTDFPMQDVRVPCRRDNPALDRHSKPVIHALLDDQFEADESELDEAAAGE